MEYYFSSDNLTKRSFTVKQFENFVTKLNFNHSGTYKGTDMAGLMPVLLVSTGDVIPVGDELSYVYDIDTDYVKVTWCISERYTQRAGSYYIQLAFSDEEENVKLYSEKLMMIVEPSVDYERDFLEYNPLFMEKFKQDILTEIEGKIPTKTSDLENDSGYLSKERDLSGYATSEYVDTLVKQTEDKTKWRQIIKFTTPFNSTKTVENVDVAFDSTDKYIENIFMALDSNGESFALKDAVIYIKRAVSMGAAVSTKLYGNAANIDSDGTLLLNAEGHLEKGKTVLTHLSASRMHNRWQVKCIKQHTDDGTKQANIFEIETSKLTDETITSLKLSFTPATTPTVNIFSGTTVEVWGIDA